MDRERLAEVLRIERARRKLSLRQVAESTGISTSVISEMENARRDVRYDSVLRLLDFYDLELATKPKGGNEPEQDSRP
jgi:transcriptional regulator with XRE-family HTH domain